MSPYLKPRRIVMSVESISTESENIYSDYDIYEASSESWNGRSVARAFA